MNISERWRRQCGDYALSLAHQIMTSLVCSGMTSPMFSDVGVYNI